VIQLFCGEVRKVERRFDGMHGHKESPL
jgi:hypothetical protein